jgi:hypothetical protein
MLIWPAADEADPPITRDIAHSSIRKTRALRWEAETYSKLDEVRK